jgi:hypothetical protein
LEEIVVTKIAAYLPGFDDKSQAARQTDESNLRDSWLRQMELAQMSGMNRNSARPAAGNVSNAGNAGNARNLLPQIPTATGDKQSSAVSPQAVARDRLDTMHAADDAIGGIAMALLQAAGASDHATSTADLTGMSLVLAGGLRGEVGQTVSNDALIAQQPLPRTLPPIGFAATVAVSDKQDATLSSAETAAAEPVTDTFHEEQKAAWQKRMMHMTNDGDDVRLWIRDRELNTTQTGNLMSRLASDIAAMGLRLKDATVNGKLVLRYKPADRLNQAPRTDTPDIFDTSAAASSGQARDFSNSTNINLKEDHGT